MRIIVRTVDAEYEYDEIRVDRDGRCYWLLPAPGGVRPETWGDLNDMDNRQRRGIVAVLVDDGRS